MLDLGAGGLLDLNLRHHVDIEVFPGTDSSGKDQHAEEKEQGSYVVVEGLYSILVVMLVFIAAFQWCVLIEDHLFPGYEAMLFSLLIKAFWAANSIFSSNSRTSIGLRQ